MQPLRHRPHRASCLIVIIVMVAGHTQAATPNLKIATTCYPVRLHDPIIEKTIVRTKSRRAAPFEILMPGHPGRYPLVIFSHGALSSPDRYYALLKPVAAAGYIIVAPRHLDSELWGWQKPPAQADVWTSRIEDMAIGLSYPPAIRNGLLRHAIRVKAGKTAAMGHSFGALIAQISGGAKALTPTSPQTGPTVNAVVAFSPPGTLPGLIDRSGWHTMTVPSLTITGTTDVLPGFIDDWKTHTQSFEFAPAGRRWLWVGDGIDHYFGGMIGREKAASKASRLLFERAVATTISFLDRTLNVTSPCMLGQPVPGETLTRDD